MLFTVQRNTCLSLMPPQMPQMPQGFSARQTASFTPLPDPRTAHPVFAQLPSGYPLAQLHTQAQEAQIRAQAQAQLQAHGWLPAGQTFGSFCFALPAPAFAPSLPATFAPSQMPLQQTFVAQQPQRQPQYHQHQQPQPQQMAAAPAPQASLLRGIPRGVDYEQVDIGEPLHSGKSRDIYPVISPATGASTGQVLVVERSRRNDSVHREVELLARLNEAGFPVAAVQSCGNFDDRAARLMPQLEPVDIEYGSFQESPNVTSASIACLQRILYLMDTQNLRIQGLQLLMNPADGNVYVSGARSVTSSWTQDLRTGQMRPYAGGSRTHVVDALQALQLRAAQPQG